MTVALRSRHPGLEGANEEQLQLDKDQDGAVVHVARSQLGRRRSASAVVRGGAVTGEDS